MGKHGRSNGVSWGKKERVFRGSVEKGRKGEMSFGGRYCSVPTEAKLSTCSVQF